ncbi:MAG: Glycosyl transferase family 2 [Microgenomates group bacterium GW2011_GWC1_39_12]|nr:MAG: Glycosyl transferase family 2 [Microgenomates group bacterium GW2011_GWC1_39_12]
MTISVVIPAYNEEELLPKTLASLSQLDRKPDEIIVVDASSTDKTAEMARNAGAVVVTVPKKTIGFSRQQGLLKATGDIVATTDADAILPHDWLNRIEHALITPGVIGYFGGFRVFDGPPVYKFFINSIQPLWNVFLFTVFRMPMATGQNMAFYRKLALEVGGFPENFRMAEDIEIARRMMTKGKIVFTQKEFVSASGRRGFEKGLILRVFKVFFLYFLFRKADTIGFPDVRK